jgi:glycolate oxidase FAD binding subunit
MELMDGTAASRLGEKGKYLVAFSLEGVEEAVERQTREIGETGRKEGAVDTKVLRGGEDRTFWIGVRDFPLRANAPVILKSNFVISKAADILGRYENWAQGAGIGCAFIGHAGNGILRTYLLDEAAAKPETVVDLIGRFTAEAVGHDGNLVVESCPGELKARLDIWGRQRTDYTVMRRLKDRLDPAGVMNPGRFVGGI